jgi:hypothetical protein
MRGIAERRFSLMNNLTRRQLLTGAAGSLFLQSCSRQPVAEVPCANAPKPLSAVIKAAAYSQDLYDKVRRILVDRGSKR